MRVTAARLSSKGFWRRSLDEFKRLSNITFKLEGIKGPSGPLVLHDFHSADSVRACKTLSDKDIGGSSTVSLDWVPPVGFGSLSWVPPSSQPELPSYERYLDLPALPNKNQPPPQPVIGRLALGTKGAAAARAPSSGESVPVAALLPGSRGYARFHGIISTELPPDRPTVQRSGYAAWRTRDPKPTLFGRTLFNIDMYAYLALRIRSDGGAYLVNVQTESVVPTDLHQHRLFARRPGMWETVLIKWNDFVRTNHGVVVEPQAEMLRQKVRTIGIGLTNRQPGRFELHIDRIWATNDLSDGDVIDPVPPLILWKGALKNKQGQRIKWSENAIQGPPST